MADPAKCVICERAFERGELPLQKHTGWQARRAQGGLNVVKFRTGYPEWAHETCLERRERGSAKLDQGGLFG
jgi:hypothetical protein